ncbi:uncharacterized protein LTR77_002597 [Saxophila tyrrhenica]|uniref:Uncharacterized protein n=1 Tax=Saxophila tyrrhenica TaxID=1690608 RepID=A0AAV9PL02_9PEZI|nr:hypothetical protein LTR77_002597 [Saxophila tyrrhenica]
MSGARDITVFKQQYNVAVGYFNEGNYEKCIAKARLTLTDDTLSRYSRVRNLLLIVSAEDNWYPTERCHRRAERVWHAANMLTKPDSGKGQAVLRKLRTKLDELRAHLDETAPSEVDEGRIIDDNSDGEKSDSESEESGCESETS